MSDTKSREPGLLDIRKYSNRRYYDTTRSKHLTLEEIRTLVRDGHAVKVTDSKTGADITAQVLTQIILELETPKLTAVPVAWLMHLIRLNEQMIKNLGNSYVNQPLQAWAEYQKQLEDRFRQMQAMPPFYSPFGAWGGMGPNFPAGGGQSGAGASVEAAEELRSMLASLQEEVAALKAAAPVAQKGRRRKSRKGA